MDEATNAATLARQLKRERSARKQAESLLEDKSRELYQANEELMKLNASLEERVRERTRELAAARDQAIEGSRIKSQFLANVSHELRTPLHSILSYSEMLQEDMVAAGDKEHLRDLKKILTAAGNLRTLINELLDFTKLEAGKMKLDITSFTVGELLAPIIDTVRPLSDSKHNRLEVNVLDMDSEMHTDRLKLAQCVTNLLTNACKFTENGTVMLRATPEQVQGQGQGQGRAWMLFEVSDTGIGMDTEQLSMLFKPFLQGDGTITRKFGGTGLGLTIANSFTSMLGGDIQVSSTPGQGTVFSLRVPVKLAPGSGRQVSMLKEKEKPDASAAESQRSDGTSAGR